jgi:hypothetical protein
MLRLATDRVAGVDEPALLAEPSPSPREPQAERRGLDDADYRRHARAAAILLEHAEKTAHG